MLELVHRQLAPFIISETLVEILTDKIQLIYTTALALRITKKAVKAIINVTQFTTLRAQAISNTEIPLNFLKV